MPYNSKEKNTEEFGTKKRIEKTYDKETVMTILADVANLGITGASKKHSVPISTIGDWVSKYADEYKEIKERANSAFINKANDVIEKYLEHLQEPEVIKKTSARDSAIVIGTLRDKVNLAQGDPTERIESDEVSGVLWREYQRDKESKG